MTRVRAFHLIGLAAVFGAALAPATLADGRKPGSVLVYPVQRSGKGLFTVINLTNTSTLPAGPFSSGGTTAVHYEYVNVVPSFTNPFLPAACEVANRVEVLTPADTRSVLTRCHNAGLFREGYLVVSAQDPNAFATPWAHDYLVGSELVVSAFGSAYSINAIPFSSPQPNGSATDVDFDGQLDFDGVEYEGVPDELFIDAFVAIGGSSLALINLTGGTAHTASIAFDVWNDNEFALSATLSFRCWFEERLTAISLVFDESFLRDNTPDDPQELDLFCEGIGHAEVGWARIRGLVASSSAESIPNPALLGALTAGHDPFFKVDTGHLLWESVGLQLNGDFLKSGSDDPEN